MEVKKSIISVSGTSIPGITRDGLFIGEAPIETYCWFRMNDIASNQTPQIVLDYPVLIETIFFEFEEVPNYPIFFQVEAVSVGQFDGDFKFEEQHLNKLGNLYQIEMPVLPLMEGTKINFLGSHVLRAVHLYCKLIQIIDVKSF